MGCDIWQEDLPRNQTHHTLQRPAKRIFFINVIPALTMHIRVWNISGKLLSILNVDPLFILSLYSRRMLGKQFEIRHNHFHFSECNPYHSISYPIVISHFQLIQCCSVKTNIAECTSLLAIRISLVMSPPHLSISPLPPYRPPSKSPHLG